MLRILKVTGHSLAPAYQDGDFVLVMKYFSGRFARAGDVVAFHQPGYGLLIKRVERQYSESAVWVLGNHPASVDSRFFGPVRVADLLGKVILHLRKTS